MSAGTLKNLKTESSRNTLHPIIIQCSLQTFGHTESAKADSVRYITFLASSVLLLLVLPLASGGIHLPSTSGGHGDV
jgi:hypothetical protein